jgi:homocysteine S-methyltransferase
MPDFLTRLAHPRPILLDGPTGTELQRQGVELKTPLWSAAAIEGAPDVLAAIHRDYVEAGAEIVTANTFRTHAVNLAAAGMSHRAAELTARAVDIARDAADGRALIAGSIAPVADCYSPDATPEDDALIEAHQAHAANLHRAGVDLLLVETQVTIREAVIAARAAVATGLPTLVSFVVGSDGRLLSGESLTDAASAVLPLGVQGVLVNCLPIERVPDCLTQLRSVPDDVAIGVYANAGWMRRDGTWEPSRGADPVAYGQAAEGWLKAGAHIIGSCCGTSVEHIRELRKRLKVA